MHFGNPSGPTIKPKGVVRELNFEGWGLKRGSTGTFEQILTYVVFTGWLSYALGAASGVTFAFYQALTGTKA